MADGSVLIDTKLDSSGLQKGLDSLGGIASRGLSVVTKAIAGVSTAIAAVGTYAVKMGSDFESAMSEVAAISGATAEDMDRLTEKAKQMGATTKFSASQSAEAFKYMAMAGWKTEDMLNGIEGIMNLAAASGEDLGVSSDIVTDALTAMGYAAGDAGRLADVMAAASSNANTNVALMGETFKYAAPLMGAMNYTMEDTALAIGLMANAGIKGSQAGTSLRSMITRLSTAPTDEVANTMAEFGISLTDSTGAMKPFREVMSDLRREIRGCDPEVQAYVASTLAGQEAMSGFLAIVNASDDDFNKLANAIDHSTDGMGAAAEMAQKMQDNLQGDITIMQSAMEGVGISIYEHLVDPLRDATQTGTKMFEQLNSAIADGGLDGLVQAAGDVLVQIVAYIGEVIPTVVDMAVQLIESFCQSLTDNAQSLAVTATGIGVRLVEGILTIVPKLLEAGLTIITELGNGIANALPHLIPMAAKCGEQIINTLIEAAPRMMEAAENIIHSLAVGLQNAAPTLESNAVTLINALYEGVLTAIPKLADAAVKIMDGLGGYLEKNLPTIIDAGLEMLVGLTDSLRKNAGKVVDGAIALAKSLAQGLADSIPTIIKNVPTIVSNIANTINDNGPKILKAGIEIIATLIKGLIQSIPTLVASIPKIIGALVDVWQAFNWLDLGKTAITKLKDGVLGMLSAVKSAGTNVLNTITTSLKNLPSNLVSLAQNGFTGFVNGIRGMVGTVTSAAQSILSAIVNTISTLPSKMLTIGKNIVQGLWNGISDMTGWIVSKFREFGDTVLNGLKKFFKIASPSKLMRDVIGKNLGLGVAVGVDATADDVEKSLEGLADKAKILDLADRMKSEVVNQSSRTGAAITKSADSGVTSQSAIDYDELAEAIWENAPDMDTYLDGEKVSKKLEPKISERQAEKAEAAKRRGGGKSVSI